MYFALLFTFLCFHFFGYKFQSTVYSRGPPTAYMEVSQHKNGDVTWKTFNTPSIPNKIPISSAPLPLTSDLRAIVPVMETNSWFYLKYIRPPETFWSQKAY